jgi:hypothetical protein
MTDRDGDADRLQDRLSKRFDSDEPEESAKQTKQDNQDKSTKQEKSTKQTKETTGGEDIEEAGGETDKTAGESRSETVDYRDEWNTRLVYLPDNLSDLLEYQYKRLDLETDWEVKKEQHFYPVVVAHGIEHIAEMDPEEFTAAVESLGIDPT